MSIELRATVRTRDVELELELPGGQTVAVLGPNGAGKTTLLGLLAGLVRADAGRAALDGDVLFDTAHGMRTPSHRRRIALLDQRASLFPHLDALGNVAFGARSVGPADVRTRAAAWLAGVGAGDLAARRPSQLSGGQAQRVALARALAAEPRLVLLDEPLAAVDVAQAPELRRMLRRVLRERSALIVTHDVLDVWSLADRVVVVEQGRVVADGATAEVLRRPPTPFVAELTGLGLLEGVWTGRSLRLSDGRVVPAGLAPGAVIPADEPVRAAIDPSAVRIADAGGVPARVIAIEPRGATVRVRTDLVPVDVSAELAARFAEGDSVLLVLPAIEVEPVTSVMRPVGTPPR